MQPENVRVSVKLVVDVDASVYVNVAYPDESVITAVIGVSALRPAIVGVRTVSDLPAPKLSLQRTFAVTVAPGATRIVLAVGEISESAPVAETLLASPAIVRFADVAAAVHEVTVKLL